MAMFVFRATPLDSKLPSPADMSTCRPIITMLPSRTSPSPITLAQRQQLEHGAQTVNNEVQL